ncbi:hypothetical protein RHMOL_Rhmol06G0237500 [Rhododendron molle]|uniref:Uncharacterized protein n=2 Tax=Rhododendron molle TaxID=49168 RepID=A0ACC0NFP9_RHOML|nr:hypothetical protein RHMOL_Rhmol06G0237400 [Rhododendron molle]KAI8552087.1 hypothetical protein RHMOL_Rhmol06G0237500 [Rhododendron molle]
MGSKTIVFLGLLATVLLVTSEVTARDLTETSKQTTAKQTKGVEEAKHPGGGGVVVGVGVRGRVGGVGVRVRVPGGRG